MEANGLASSDLSFMPIILEYVKGQMYKIKIVIKALCYKAYGENTCMLPSLCSLQQIRNSAYCNKLY
jgi:hypothetical protein